MFAKIIFYSNKIKFIFFFKQYIIYFNIVLKMSRHFIRNGELNERESIFYQRNFIDESIIAP